MAATSEEAIKQFSALMEQLEEPLKTTVQNVHQGNLRGTLVRFLKAREWSAPKAHKMMLTMITTVDDLNYPEKTETYYIVNAPYVFSACWKVVKPLLQERTKKKIQVLYGSGRDELLKVMDYESLPHFCKREGPGSSHSLSPVPVCHERSRICATA